MEDITSSNLVNLFPLEVMLNIFKFLGGKDLLTASLVSTDWYNVIAESPECMKQLKVNIKCCQKEMSPEDISWLADSRRKYENLEIARCCHCIDETDPLIGTPYKTWKRVTFTRVSFNNSSQALYYLACIEKSVEELIMSGIFIKSIYPEAVEQKFTFAKLRVLNASHLQPFLFQKALDKVTNLEQLMIWSRNQTDASLACIKRMLKVNNKLKILEIFGNVFDQIMFENIVPDLQFKLRKLSVNNHHRSLEYYDKIQDNFTALLKSQCKTLETLYLGGWNGVDVLKEVYRLPNLKNLTMKGLANAEDPVDWESLVLQTNNSIFELNLQNVPSNFTMLRLITTEVPKLRVFRISFMETLLMNHMSTNHKDLKTLDIAKLRVSDVADKTLFQSLKHLFVKSYNAILETRIMEKAETDLGHFESLLKHRFVENFDKKM